MDYITRRYGREVTLEDALRVNNNVVGALLKMYDFKCTLKADKQGRARQLQECMNSQPDVLFELPTWEDIPVGTVFMASGYDGVCDSDHIFYRVIAVNERGCCQDVLVQGVLTDYVAGLSILKQSDADILANRGFEECTDARPSDIPYISAKYRVGLVPDKALGKVVWEWRPLRTAESVPSWPEARTYRSRTKPTVYVPKPCGPSYSCRIKHVVSKSAVHPWLEYGTFVHAIAATRARDSKYRPSSHRSASLMLRDEFKTDTLMHCEHATRESQTTLADVLFIFADTPLLPTNARRALMKTSTTLRDALLTLDEDRKKIIQKASATLKSPRGMLRAHFQDMLEVAAGQYRSSDGSHACSHECSFMPYRTPYRFVISVGVSLDEAGPISFMFTNTNVEKLVTVGIQHDEDAEVHPLFVTGMGQPNLYVLRKYDMCVSKSLTRPRAATGFSSGRTLLPLFFKTYLIECATILENAFSDPL